ncbi:hypothetical protein HHI36_016627, partial [Cryptolaemus montrouzieri]
MADANSTRDQELLSNELNKLNKNTLTDILVTQIVPNEVVNDTVRKYFEKIFNNCENSFVESGTVNKPLNDQVCSAQNYRHLKREIELINSLNNHLEMRISDQSEIISLLKLKND